MPFANAFAVIAWITITLAGACFGTMVYHLNFGPREIAGPAMSGCIGLLAVTFGLRFVAAMLQHAIMSRP